MLHCTYIMSQVVNGLGVAATFSGVPSAVTFLLQLPTYEEWFKAKYNITAKKDELDSWLNSYTLTLLLMFERSTLQGLPRNLYFCTSAMASSTLT